LTAVTRWGDVAGSVVACQVEQRSDANQCVGSVQVHPDPDALQTPIQLQKA
jgi:hypothetical protein